MAGGEDDSRDGTPALDHSGSSYPSLIGVDPGEEFHPPVPRPIPRFIRRGRYAMSRMAMAWTLLIIGAACCLTHPLPFVVQLSWYLLPLGYLDWIGWGLLGLGVVILIRNLVSLGRMKYIRDGIPIAGRVTNVSIQFQGMAEAQSARFVADVEFVHPETGQLTRQQIATPDAYTRFQFASLSPGVSPGSVVTLVALPGKVAGSLALYGWTGLSPGCDLLMKHGRPLRPVSPLTAIAVVLGIMALCWGLLGFLYVLGRYTPTDEADQRDPTLYLLWIGACGVIGILLALRLSLKERQVVRTIAVAFLGTVFGASFGIMSLFFTNGYFDDSPPRFEPVEVVQLWHETIEFMIRTYQIEYRGYPNGVPHKTHVSFETLGRFDVNSLGVINVGSGRLGLPWVRGFHPIRWLPANPADPPGPDTVVFQIPGEPVRSILPRIELTDGIHSPPEVLVPALKERVERYLKGELNATILNREAP